MDAIAEMPYHNQVDKGDSIGVDARDSHTANHMDYDHAYNRHDDDGSPQVQTHHQKGHHKHSS